MKLKSLFEKFKNAVTALYGAQSVEGRTKAAKERQEAEITARPGTFEGAMAARFVRDVRNSDISRMRKNTRGLPKGYGVHQAKRARLLARSKKHRDRATMTELQAAQTFLDDAKRCEQLRARARAMLTPEAPEGGRLKGRASRSFLKRVMPSFRAKSLQLLQAIIRHKMDLAEQSERVPYLRPVERPELRPAAVKHLAGGAIEVTPLPSAA